MRRKEFAVIKPPPNLSWNYFWKRLIGLIYINYQKAKQPVPILCDRDIRIATLSSLPFSLSSSLFEILSTFLSLSFHLSSAFPLRFRLALATHSPDIERTSRGLLPRTGGCSRRSWLAGWQPAAVAFTDLPQRLSLLLGREIEFVFFDVALLSDPTSSHCRFIYGIESNAIKNKWKINKNKLYLCIPSRSNTKSSSVVFNKPLVHSF